MHEAVLVRKILLQQNTPTTKDDWNWLVPKFSILVLNDVAIAIHKLVICNNSLPGRNMEYHYNHKHRDISN